MTHGYYYKTGQISTSAYNNEYVELHVHTNAL